MTFAFLLLERAEVTQGQYPTGRNDIAEAALALATAADLCENALRQMENADATENDGAIGNAVAAGIERPAESANAAGIAGGADSTGGAESEATAENAGTAAGTADVDGFGYPRWSDLFDCRLERAYLARGVSKAQWAQEMRATIAWRCRSLLSDLAGANAQGEEAVRQAQVAVLDLPHEAESLLRLARNEAITGQLELAAHHYRAGLALTPFAYAAWPELAAVLVALGQRDAAQTFVQERLRVINAIPTFAAIRPALMAAIE